MLFLPADLTFLSGHNLLKQAGVTEHTDYKFFAAKPV